MFPVKAPTVCSDTTVIPSNLPTSSSTLFPGKMDESITGGPSRRRAHTRHGNVGQLGSYAATAGYRWWHLHLQLRLNPRWCLWFSDCYNQPAMASLFRPLIHLHVVSLFYHSSLPSLYGHNPSHMRLWSWQVQTLTSYLASRNQYTNLRSPQ